MRRYVQYFLCAISKVLYVYVHGPLTVSDALNRQEVYIYEIKVHPPTGENKRFLRISTIGRTHRPVNVKAVSECKKRGLLYYSDALFHYNLTGKTNQWERERESARKRKPGPPERRRERGGWSEDNHIDLRQEKPGPRKAQRERWVERR